jgi:hypothetical protein
MKSLLIALLLLSPVAAFAQEAPDNLAHGVSPKPVAVPFHFSSFDTAFAMQGDFEGEYRVFPDSMEVRLTKGLVRIGMHCPYKGRRDFTALSFTLATEKPNGKWNMAFKSPRLPVGLIMRPGDEYTFEGEVHFSIPKEPTTDLSKYWLVAEMEDIVLDRPNGEPLRAGYAFAMSCKDIFSKP